MAEIISYEEWHKLPKEAQREVKDFFLFIKSKYAAKQKISETAVLSEQSLAEDWLKQEENEAWAQFQ
ncbi:MAG: hypothetical protein WAO12_12790 [Venatoribacter sp.]